MKWLAFALTALIACGDDGDDEPPGEPGTFTITGTIRYDDRPQLGTGGLGDVTSRPARGVHVSLIVDRSNAVFAETVADDTGAYTFVVDGLSNARVHVLAATTSTLATRPINVRHAQTEIIHGFGGPTFGLGNSTQDLLVEVDSGIAEAFNIFDVLVDVMDRIPTLFPGRQAQELTAFWNTGNPDGTFYFNSGLFLLGDDDDSDGYDDTVILHEAGHWIEDVIGRSDSPGGDHDGSPTNPTLAWSEGFATYFSMAMTDQPIYSDSNAGGGFAFNGDTSNTKASAAAGLGQNVSEDMVTEILWDMSDAPAIDDDTVSGTHLLVLAVEGFLKFASLRAIGTNGVDLVDFLDGWFINNGLTSCAGMRALVNVQRTFPYDYGSPAGVCPQ